MFFCMHKHLYISTYEYRCVSVYCRIILSTIFNMIIDSTFNIMFNISFNIILFLSFALITFFILYRQKENGNKKIIVACIDHALKLVEQFGLAIGRRICIQIFQHTRFLIFFSVFFFSYFFCFYSKVCFFYHIYLIFLLFIRIF